MGCEIVDVTLSPLGAYADCAALISRTEAFSIHEDYLRKTPELYGELARQRIMMGALVRGSDYVNALRQRGALIAEIARCSRRSIFITPTMPTVAPKLGELGNMMSRSRPFHARLQPHGSPALSVCSGFSKAGLPLNMQIIGRPVPG